MQRPALVLALLLLSPTARAQETIRHDLIVRGGHLVDGSGAAPRRVDIGVRDGRIATLGDLTGAEATRVIDATNLTVAPGFVDVHTHAESITSRPEAANFLAMGVTTLVSGNCGSSRSDLDKMFQRLERSGISANFASLIGHGTVRRAAMENAARTPTDTELAAMQAHVRRAMAAGAVGLSTGLIYVPGTYAKTEEIAALAKVVGEFDGVYASHMRNENDDVLEAIDEALQIGREGGVRVHLSHLKASGKHNWGRGAAIVARLRAARESGAAVTGDQYAYAASSTSLDVLFPSAELSIGRRAFAAKLRDDSAFRTAMREALFSTMDRTGFGDLSYCRIASAPTNADLNGRTLADAAKLRHGDSDRATQAQLALDLVVDAAGKRISMIYHTMSERDVRTLMQEPFIAVASDAGIRLRRTADKPHPRGAGNNPRVLARYVRDQRTLPLAAAVHKMTGLPAKVFGLDDRGVVRVGAWADLVVFDAATVTDRATFDEPIEPPDGIPYVVVNGVVVVDDGVHNGARPGQVLRHHPTTDRRPR